ncbi:MAG: PAS domain S-box protein [Anaerolineaceae bacterium]|nr:PAS domain S-box protein [Anaerolineaceae bacterium]
MDTTESKPIEQMPQESTELLRAILDSFPGNSVILDQRGHITLVNQNWIDFGRANGLDDHWQWAGLDYLKFCRDATKLGSEVAREACNGITAVLDGQAPYFEYEYPCHSPRERRWFQMRASAVTYTGRRSVIVIHQDITHQKQAEEALRESEELHRLTLSYISDAVFITDVTGAFTFICPNVHVIFGYSQSEVQTFGNIAALLGDGLFEPDALKTLGEIPNIERRVSDKAGREHDLLVTVKRIALKAGTILYTCRDITERKRAEQKGRESEARFRATFEQAAVGIAHVAPDGRFLRLNQRFCQLVGSSHDELVVRTFQDITHPDDLAADLEYMRQLLADNDETFTMEKRYLRKDGEIVWVNLTVSLLRKATGEPDYFISVVEDITKRKQVEVQLQAYQFKLKLLAAELTLAEERERRRIAAELHDEVGQTLTSAGIQIALAIMNTSEAKVIAILHDVGNTISQVIEEIHDMVFDLSSPLLDEIGLAAALAEWLVEKVEKKHGLQTEFVGLDQKMVLDDDVETILFRNVRELLTNVIKHAQASKVTVRVEQIDDRAMVVVQDDGQGFDPLAIPTATDREGRFGLFSIRERMADLGGMLEIVSAPGQGCTATLIVPLSN